MSDFTSSLQQSTGIPSSRFTQISGKLIELEPFYVIPLGLVPLFTAAMLPSYVVWGSLLIVLMPWILRFARYRYLSVRTRLDVPWAFFLLGAVIGLYVSVDLRLSIERLYGIVGGAGAYYLIVNTVSTRYLKVYLLLLFTGALLSALWGLKQAPLVTYDMSRLLWAVDWIHRVVPNLFPLSTNASGIAGPLVANPNGVAGLLVVSLPLSGALALMPYSDMLQRNQVKAPPSQTSNNLGASTKVPLFRAFCLIAFVAQLALLVLTNSRGGFIAFLLSLIACLSITNRKLLLMAPISAALAYGVIARFISSPDRLWDTTNGVGRVGIWQSAYYMLQDFAYTGVGLGSFPYIYPFYMLPSNWGDVAYVHNAYLEVYLDQGLVGFSGWLVILFTLALTLVCTARRQSRRTFGYVLGVGLVGSFVGFTTQGMFESSGGFIFYDAIGVLHGVTSPMFYVLAGFVMRWVDLK